MSASVDHVSKGPTSQSGSSKSGPGGEVKDPELEVYLQQHQAPPIGNHEQYFANYYQSYAAFPYFGADRAWSNGGDPFSFANYGQPGADYMQGNGMFNAFNYSHPGFVWPSFPGAEYSWGATTVPPSGSKGEPSDASYKYYSAMSPSQMYPQANGKVDMGMKCLEQGLQEVSVRDKEMSDQVRTQELNEVHAASSSSHSTVSPVNAAVSAKKPMSWASVASQPARTSHCHPLQHGHLPTSLQQLSSHAMDVAWEKAAAEHTAKGVRPANSHQPPSWTAPRTARSASNGQQQSGGPPMDIVPRLISDAPAGQLPTSPHPVLEKLKSTHTYNPKNFDLCPKNSRFFIIKSYSEDDIHRSIKYSIWCSTDHGNKRLDSAYQEREGKGPVYLFYSVNGSGHFCGMAQMMSRVDYHSQSGVWTQDKWKGQFEVKWIYIKDIPNGQLRHIRLENNENKPVTNSRDTQEVPPEKGKQVLKILHEFANTTSIFDDFSHYEKKQEDDESRKKASAGH